MLIENRRQKTVHESNEDKTGVIMDYDKAGNLVSIEVFDASQRVMLPNQIEYQVIPSVINNNTVNAYVYNI